MNVSKHEYDKLFKEAGVQNKKQQRLKLSRCSNIFKISWKQMKIDIPTRHDSLLDRSWLQVFQ